MTTCYFNLKDLYNKHGPHEFGRICQALLEISLREISFKTRGRAVERPDISAERGTERYAIEAKVPFYSEISITNRDLDGLKEFSSLGVTPILATLLIEPTTKWVFAKANLIKQGKYSKIELINYDVNSVSLAINKIFPQIVERVFDLAMGRGSEGLREQLDN